MDGNTTQCFLGVNAKMLAELRQLKGFPGFIAKKLYSKPQLQKWLAGEMVLPAVHGESNTISMTQIEEETNTWLKELNIGKSLISSNTQTEGVSPNKPSAQRPALSLKEGGGRL